MVQLGSVLCNIGLDVCAFVENIFFLFYKLFNKFCAANGWNLQGVGEGLLP